MTPSKWSMRAQGALLGMLAAGIGIALLVLVSLLAQQRLGRASVERYGSTITSQLAALAATPVVTDNRIDLRVIITHLSDDPAIVNAAVYTLDNRLIGTGGRVPVEATMDAPDDTVFKRPITFETQRVGYVRLVVDAAALAPSSSPFMWVAALLGLALATWLGATLGEAREQRLHAIAARLSAAVLRNGDEVDAATQRQVATARLESLALQLAPDPEPEPIAPPEPDGTAPPYLLLLNLFNQGSLRPADRDAAYSDCEKRLQRVLELYKGRALRLPGTGFIALFECNEGDDHTFSAICAALLALRLTAALNDERKQNELVALNLRGGLVQLTSVPDMRSDEAVLRDSLASEITAALVLSATARDQSLAVERSVFADLNDNQRVSWTAIRSPLPNAEDAGAFHYQISNLKGAQSNLLDGQIDRLLAAPTLRNRMLG